jgi:hypothetical protein
LQGLLASPCGSRTCNSATWRRNFVRRGSRGVLSVGRKPRGSTDPRGSALFLETFFLETAYVRFGIAPRASITSYGSLASKMSDRSLHNCSSVSIPRSDHSLDLGELGESSRIALEQACRRQRGSVLAFGVAADSQARSDHAFLKHVHVYGSHGPPVADVVVRHAGPNGGDERRDYLHGCSAGRGQIRRSRVAPIHPIQAWSLCPIHTTRFHA